VFSLNQPTVSPEYSLAGRRVDKGVFVVETNCYGMDIIFK
jgi:hypothetical protein